MFSSLTLHSNNAFLQPSTKLPTCSSFHRVRMIPTRISDPSRLVPKETSLSAAYNDNMVSSYDNVLMDKRNNNNNNNEVSARAACHIILQHNKIVSPFSRTLRATPKVDAALGTKQVATGAVAKARVSIKFLIVAMMDENL
jgi:hypothetical protein